VHARLHMAPAMRVSSTGCNLHRHGQVSTTPAYAAQVSESDADHTSPSRDAFDDLFEGRDEVLSAHEVAELLHMTNQAIYNWLAHGTIPGFKVGSGWFILCDELKASLRARHNERSRRSQPERDGD